MYMKSSTIVNTELNKVKHSRRFFYMILNDISLKCQINHMIIIVDK